MKYLIYELFSGVGFCNQLFSLETAIYLANITNRKLILLVRHPLCHCGRASWDYGYFLNFFTNDYKQYLPHGIEVYYKMIPQDITNIINSSEKIINKNFSQIVIVDSELDTHDNSLDIKEFCNFRTKISMDFNSIKSDYIYICNSNASRCFYNFYTNKNNYIIMSKIAESLTKLNKRFCEIFQILIKNIQHIDNSLAIHIRFGDVKHSKEIIDKNTINYYNSIKEKISDKRDEIIIMADRQDGKLLELLEKDYKIIFTHKIIDDSKNILQDYFPEIKKLNVIKFLLEKKICEKAYKFIGNIGSTVSNHIQYSRHINNKNSNCYLDKYIQFSNFNTDNNNSYTWKNNGYVGTNIGWKVFFPENIKIKTVKIITLTNDGYIDLTENLLISMQKLNIEKLLKIYCIGEKSYNYFKNKYSENEVELVDLINKSETVIQNWIEYRSIQSKDEEGKKIWSSITSYKFYSIHKELMQGNNVIFIDGDIVFEKNPFDYLQNEIGDNDILIQNDFQTNENCGMCTGFFYMKSNEKTLKITNFSEIRKNLDTFNNDQQYLRRFNKELNVKYLDLNLFPNGKYWRDKLPSSPYIIHFNYDTSKMKIIRMKKYYKWYI